MYPSLFIFAQSFQFFPFRYVETSIFIFVVTRTTFRFTAFSRELFKRFDSKFREDAGTTNKMTVVQIVTLQIGCLVTLHYHSFKKKKTYNIPFFRVTTRFLFGDHHSFLKSSKHSFLELSEDYFFDSNQTIHFKA